MLRSSFIILTSLFLSATAFAATYEVPVDGAEESPFAHFEIQDFKISRDEKHLTMSYALPLEVTGAKNIISLSGDLNGTNLFRLKGENAVANCKLAESTCSIRYRDLHFDQVLIEARLNELSLTPEEFEARLSVARQFKADPIGFLKFP